MITVAKLQVETDGISIYSIQYTVYNVVRGYKQCCRKAKYE